jgi:glycosyltransferase involved in cell wall biosynthesis
LFTYSVVVVDNDREQSARTVAASFKDQGRVRINYYVEPVQNIALARNKAVQNAIGAYIAFVDDDEYPIDEWLLTLYGALNEYRADGVLGPVIPYFESEPPEWVVKGGLCERKRFATGTHIRNHRDTRTGNVLLSKRVFDGDGEPFDARFGETGGEDAEFFRRRLEEGRRFVWCNEACVYEAVPADRLRRKYFLRRAFLRGVANSQCVSVLSISVLKSAAAALVYALSLPLLVLGTHHTFMKSLIKLCDHLGKLLGVLGVKVITKRDF